MHPGKFSYTSVLTDYHILAWRFILVRTDDVDIDPVRQPHYIGYMPKKTAPALIDQELEQLEEKVDGLLDIITRLMQENQSLRAQQVAQASERAGMLERHDEVRNRVDAIVTRLKSLETNI